MKRDAKLGKAGRTRAQLIDAATRMYSRTDVGNVTILGLAEEARIANGTVYNYFRSREEILEATGIELADRFSSVIAKAYKTAANGAERMAIGQRWFVLHAQEEPIWAKAVIRIFGSAKALRSIVAGHVTEDLRLGLSQGYFTYKNEAVALDFCLAAACAAMRTAVEGSFIPEHDILNAEMVLRALGVSARIAERLARTPLPELSSSPDRNPRALA